MAIVKGKLVVFEGLDGSGKGTMIRLTKNYLLARGIAKGRILVTQEPTEGKYGKKIKEMLREEKEPEKNAKKFLDLYLRDRKEHLKEQILPALQKGKIILCDRYKYSTIAYQSAQGLDRDEIVALHSRMQKPDLAIILDLPVSVALERVKRDEKRGVIEKFEKAFFLKKVRENFLDMRNIFQNENIKIINASLPADEVFKEIIKEINKLLKFS